MIAQNSSFEYVQRMIYIDVNPSHAEATFVQSTSAQIFMKTIRTLSCWYSLYSFCQVLSDEYTHVPGFH